MRINVTLLTYYYRKRQNYEYNRSIYENQEYTIVFVIDQ